MKLVALFVLACTVSAAQSRELLQAPTATYPSLAAAVAAAQANATNLSILLQAVEAANLTGALGPNTTWTILAPTNEAFETRLPESLGITPQQLLQPANRATLVRVLSYHVIPSGAVYSANLTDGQSVPTALQGAAPLTVSISDNGTVEFEGAEESADVITPDIIAGTSVIHVIDDVLLPEANDTNAVAANTTAAGAPAGTTRDTAVGGGASTAGAAPAAATSPSTAVGGGAAAPPATTATGAAGAIKVPAVLLASMLLIGMLF